MQQRRRKHSLCKNVAARVCPKFQFTHCTSLSQFKNGLCKGSLTCDCSFPVGPCWVGRKKKKREKEILALGKDQNFKVGLDMWLIAFSLHEVLGSISQRFINLAMKLCIDL